MRVVELLNVVEGPLVFVGDEVDCDTLATETATTSDTMDVVFAIGGKVVVDDQGDLIKIE